MILFFLKNFDKGKCAWTQKTSVLRLQAVKEAVGERLQTKIATTESRSTLADFLSQAVQAGHHQSLTERQRNVLGLRYGAG